MKKILFISLLITSACSNGETCGTVLEKRETTSPYLVQIRLQQGDGYISNIVTDRTSLQVGDYTCFD